MSNINKLLGSIIGGVLGLLAAKFGLPEGIASPALVEPLAALLGSWVGVYFAPKNVEPPAA